MSAVPARSIECAYRQRSYPSPTQQRQLQRLFGARRYVWNWAWRRQDEHYRTTQQHLSWVALSREFTALRTAPDTAWLAELPREPFNQTLRDLNRAWQNYLRGRAARPRKKAFGTVQSARFTLDQRRQQVDRAGGTVQLDGVGRVPFVVSRPLAGRLRSATLSRDAAGRWFVALTADGVPAPHSPNAPREAVGVDRGVREVAVTSQGERIAATRRTRAVERALKRHQRAYARGYRAALARAGLDPTQPCPKGTRLAPSNRMRRRQQKLGRLQAQLADLRREALHQASHRLVVTHQVIALESLNVRGLARTLRRGFRRRLHEAGMGELARQLAYKASWHRRTIVKVDPFFPSSQLCSTPGCDYRNTNLKLRERHWRCPQCGVVHDRDVNAARNIEREGLRLLAATPRSGESHARGEAACGAEAPASARQPTSRKREPGRPAAARQRAVVPPAGSGKATVAG